MQEGIGGTVLLFQGQTLLSVAPATILGVLVPGGPVASVVTELPLYTCWDPVCLVVEEARHKYPEISGVGVHRGLSCV